MIIDAHADISSYLVSERKDGNFNALREQVLPNLLAGGLTGVVNAIYLSEEERQTPKESALVQLTELRRQLDHVPEIKIVTTADELRQANEAGKIGFFLSLEGAEPVEKWADLELFYKKGIRFIGLTHNPANQYSGAAMAQELGLTKKGLELIDRMASLNMILDLSHLSDLSTNQALEEYKGTVIASHSNVRSICNHPRNMTDEQLKKLANRGGVVGLNVCSKFVTPDQPTVSDLEVQLHGLLNHCGEDHVAFGFDFCDRYFRDLDSTTYDVLAGPELSLEFLDRLKLPERIKDKIAWKNWMRIYETL